MELFADIIFMVGLCGFLFAFGAILGMVARSVADRSPRGRRMVEAFVKYPLTPRVLDEVLSPSE